MALNNELYNRLVTSGVSHGSALLLADPAQDVVAGVAVTDAPAVTATAVAAANATSPAGAVYTVTDQTALADLANEMKADLNALRNDVIALRTTVNNLLTSLRNSGVIAT